MKLTELQNILGEEINKVRNSGADDETVKKAQTVALLAKQVINNADVIIRFDKLKAVQPELRARIEEAIKRCQSGESIAGIARDLNLSRQHIYNILFKAGYRRITVWVREGEGK